MSAPHESGEREIALGLAEALAHALSAGATALALRAACDVADILELPGLGRLLREFEPRLGRPCPPELEPVRDRLLRMAARCRELGSLQPFNDTRAELEGLAGEVAALEWTSGAEPGSGIATLSAAQALEDLALAGDRSEATARRVHLTAPVAASLRAALDWLAARRDSRARSRCAQKSRCSRSPAKDSNRSASSRAARDPAVDGNLGPALRSGETGWIVRVPTVAQRDHFLMLNRRPARHSRGMPCCACRWWWTRNSKRARRVGMPLLERSRRSGRAVPSAPSPSSPTDSSAAGSPPTAWSGGSQRIRLLPTSRRGAPDSTAPSSPTMARSTPW